jgi:two-component system chemotaxis response regulator CheB
MLVARSGDKPVIRITDAAPVNFCKPAVDPLFDSAAEIFGANTLAVVLTGMGSDGAKGARRIADVGGSVIAQDEETSVVWGMPGATFALGACADVLPIGEIGPRIVRLLTGGRP